MASVPTSPDVWLSRADTAAALTEAGFRTSAKTLQTAATRDATLPPYRVNGKIAEHQWGPTLAWRVGKVRYRRGTPDQQQQAAA